MNTAVMSENVMQYRLSQEYIERSKKSLMFEAIGLGVAVAFLCGFGVLIGDYRWFFSASVFAFVYLGYRNNLGLSKISKENSVSVDGEDLVFEGPLYTHRNSLKGVSKVIAQRSWGGTLKTIRLMSGFKEFVRFQHLDDMEGLLEELRDVVGEKNVKTRRFIHR